jgi:hypothetical protein
MGDQNIAGLTLRGVDNDDGWGSAINVNDTKWHQFVGVWDQTTGTRTLYVDGVFSHIVFNNPTQIMSQAPGKHLALGAREGGGSDFEAYFSGLLYDVRIFNYPFTASDVAALNPPKLTVQRWTGSQVRLSWPITATGYAIEQSASLPGGWGPSGLSIGTEGSEYVAYAPASSSQRFFRLKR